MFVVCNYFVGVKHSSNHHLKRDIILKNLLNNFRNKFEHFRHDVFLIMNNHLVSSLLSLHIFN
jgi:hypothetical protein